MSATIGSIIGAGLKGIIATVGSLTVPQAFAVGALIGGIAYTFWVKYKAAKKMTKKARNGMENGVNTADTTRDACNSRFSSVSSGYVSAFIGVELFAQPGHRDVHLLAILGHGATGYRVAFLFQHLAQFVVGVRFGLVFVVNTFLEYLSYLAHGHFFAAFGDVAVAEEELEGVDAVVGLHVFAVADARHG